MSRLLELEGGRNRPVDGFPENDLILLDEAARVGRLDVLEGPTGRRGWSDREKGRIMLESFRPGARVSDVACAHGLAPQHLSMWRSLARKGKLPMPGAVADDAFAGIEVATEAAVPDPDGQRIETCVDGMSSESDRDFLDPLFTVQTSVQ